MRTRTGGSVVFWCLGVFAVAGCSDRSLPTSEMSASSVSAALGAVGTQADSTDMPMMERFSLTLTAKGAFRPGVPIVIHADIVGNLATDDAEVRVVLPEVEFETLNGWVQARGRPVHTKLKAREESRIALAAGERKQVSSTVSIPMAGYYRVVVSVSQKSREPVTFDGRWVKSVAFRELWLFISESGGQATTVFDASLTADSISLEPGMRRLLVGRGAKRSGGSGPNLAATARPSSARSSSAGLGGLRSASGTPTPRQLQYYNPDVGAYQPVAAAVVYWQVVDPFNTVTDSYYGVTDANGMYPGPCVSLPGYEYARVNYALENGDIRVLNGNGSWIEDECDPALQGRTVASETAWMYSRANEFIPFSRGVLNAARPMVDAEPVNDNETFRLRV